MAVTPNSLVTPQTPVAGKCKCTSANTNYDTPTAAIQLLAGQANGARLTKVQAVPGATVTSTDVQLYGYDGISYRHIKTVAMASQTISAGNTAAIPPVDFGYSDTAPLVLGANEQLMMAVGVAQTAVIGRCEGGAY